MKAKQISTILISVMFSLNAFALTIGNWQGAPQGDPNVPAGSGKWTDAYWNKPPVRLPLGPSVSGNEIKIIKSGSSCVLDCNVGSYECKLSIGGGADLIAAPKLEIVNGGSVGMGEIRVGSGGSSANGGFGGLFQTGGTLTLNHKLYIGRFGTSSTNPNEGKGFYTISGGTLTYAAANSEGGLYVGAAGSDGPAEGTFTVAGKGGKINVRKLYVGSDGKNAKGTGTLEFELEPDGVSAINVAEAVLLDASADESKAILVVNADMSAPKTDIVLINIEGANSATGVFDTINGAAAAEGCDVLLKADDGDYNYKLTYNGGSGNDIALKFVNLTPKAQAADANAAKK